MKLPILIIACFGSGVACVNGLWKGQPEDVVVFSAGVSLHLELGSAADVVFDEGKLGNNSNFRFYYKIQSEVLSSPHKKAPAASKP